MYTKFSKYVFLNVVSGCNKFSVYTAVCMRRALPGSVTGRRGHTTAIHGAQVRLAAELAQKLGQLQRLIAVFPQECMGQRASFGPT